MNKRPNAALLAVRRALRKVLRHWRKYFRIALVAVLIVSFTFTGASSALAAGGVVTQYINGGASASVARGAVVNLKAGVPVADAGSLTQSITQWIDPNKMQLRGLSDITAPAEWVLSYTSDGNNWTQTMPTTAAGWAAVKGVKATGAINSEGPDQSGNQIASGDATADYPSSGSFSTSGAGNGDGFDVIFDDRGNLYNIWHHNGSQGNDGIDCHTRAGARCSGSWPMRWSAGGALPQTSSNSTGWYDSVDQELWFNTSVSNVGGFVCVDLRNNAAPSWCGGGITTGFIGVQSISGCSVASYNCVYGLAESAGKLFSWNAVNGDILCVDIRAIGGVGAPCATPSVDFGTAITNATNDSDFSPELLSWDGMIFAESWSQATCLIAATMARCPGWETVKQIGQNLAHIFKLPDASGNHIGVCFASRTIVDCYNKAGTSITAGVSTTFISNFKSTTNWANQFNINSPTPVGARLYWANGGWNASGQIRCWDFSTNTWCLNWGGVSGLTVLNYSLVVDPKNENCLWTNTDSGDIKTWDAITGTNNCQARSISFDASVVVPRMGCNPDDAIKSWRTFTLNGPPSTDYTSASLTVRKQDGTPVPGWTDIPITTGTGRVIDLSTMPVSATGQKPKFIVSFTGRSTGTNATAKVSAIGDAPQLCVTPITTICPTTITAPGPYPLASLPPAETVSVFSDSDSTDGFLSVTQLTRGTANLSLPAVNQSTCVTSVSGRAYDFNQNPIVTAIVTLYDSAGAVINYPNDYSVPAKQGQPVRTTTSSTGTYSFPNLVPGDYKVGFTDATQGDVYQIIHTAGGTGTVGAYNELAPVETRVSNAVTATVATPAVVNAWYHNNKGLQLPDVSTGALGAPQVIDVYANDVVVNTKTFNKTTVKLCATGQTPPACNLTVKTIPGEGTYTVNTTTGAVTFTPEPSFVGTATPVVYQHTDNGSNVGTSTITPTVTAATITNDIGATRNDQVWSGNLNTNDGIGSQYKYAAATNPSKGTVVVNPDGTYSYTPNEGASGTDTFAYKATAPPLCSSGGTGTSLYSGTLNGNTASLKVVTGASFMDRQASNLFTNGDFNGATSNTWYRWMNVTNLYFNPAYLVPNGWNAAGGGSQTFAMWGYDSAYNSNYYNEADNGASTSMASFGNTTNSYTTFVFPAGHTWTQGASNASVVVTQPDPTLQGNSANPPTLSQDLSTEVGKTYRLHFYQGTEWAPYTTSDGIAAIEVGSYGRTFLLLDQNAKRWTFDFIATTTNTRISFMQWGSLRAGGRSLIVDDVIAQECAPGATFTATATITISGPPKAVIDSSAALTNLPQVVSPLANDSVSSSVAASGVSIDPASLRLCGSTDVAPACTQTTVTIAGKGTYALDIATSKITFTPVTDYFGSPTPVTYSISDTAQLTSTAVYQPVVEPRPSVATADRTTGNQRVNQTVTPATNDLATPGTTMTANTTRLCAANETAPNCTATTLTITGEGTYTVTTTSGLLTYVPVGEFVGVATPVTYIVKDSLNRTISSTYTPTVLGPVLTKSFIPSKVNVGEDSILTFTVTNTADNTVKWGIGFVDTLPTGMTVSAVPEIRYDCYRATVTATAGSGTITVTGLEMTVGTASCTVSLHVKASVAGSYSNGASNLTTTQLTKPSTPAVLTVEQPANVGAFVCLKEALEVNGGRMTWFDPDTKLWRYFGPTSATSPEAIGFNGLDGFIYGVATATSGGITNGDIIKISNDGSVSRVGVATVNGVATPLNASTYAGTMDDQGYLWVVGMGWPSNKLYKIDVKTLQASLVTLNQSIYTHDLVWKDGTLYGLQSTTRYTINPSTGAVTTGTFPNGWDFSHSLGQFLDPAGNWYARSYAGYYYKLTGMTGPVANMTLVTIQYMSAPDRTDATSCTDATPPPATRPDVMSAKQGMPQTVNPTTNDFASSMTKATIDPTSVKLCDVGQVTPNCNLTTRTVVGQGTYTVDPSTGAVTFTPLSTFSGIATPITYQVMDDKGEASLGTITATSVAAPAPVADTSSGAYLAVQTINALTNDVVGAGGTNAGTTLASGSIRLCDSTNTAPNCSATTVAISGQGTYTLNTSTGVITFTPVVGFAGAATPVVYSVTDSLGQKNSTTYTPTVNPAPILSKTFTPSTISAGGVGTLSIKITNTPGNPAWTGLSFTDALPAGLVIDSTPAMTGTCPGGVTVGANPTTLSATAGGTSITVTNAALTSGVASCTFTVNVKAASAGTYSNGASNITSTTVMPPLAPAVLTVKTPTLSGAFLCNPYAYNIDYGQFGIRNPVTGVGYNIGVDHGGHIQGIGFNKLDGFFYGYVLTATTSPAIAAGNIVKISSDGSLTNIGKPTINGVAISSWANIYGGDMDDTGNLVLLADWNLTNTLYKVNVSTLVTTQITMSAQVAIQDIAYFDGAFYGPAGGTLYVITPNATSNWTVTTKTITTPVSGQPTVSVYANSSELMYVMFQTNMNKVNGFTGSTPTRTLLSNVVSMAAQTDGAMCHQAPSASAPAAIADSNSAAYNTVQTIQTLANDEPSFLGGSFTTPGTATPSVKLCLTGESAPACTGTTLTVAGQGTYSVVPATGVVTFTPLNSFTGTATAVRYQVTDSIGGVASATITPTVGLPPAPVAANDTSTGLFDIDQVKSLSANDAAAPNFNIVANSVRLCAIGTNAPCSLTSLTTSDGVYTVNTTTGDVTFNPTSTFTGAATAVRYSVTDNAGQVASGTYTPTVTSKPVTVNDTSTGDWDTNQTVRPLENDSAGVGVSLKGTPSGICVTGTTIGSCTGSTLTVSGQGTYTLNANGSVVFDPLPSFVGTATAIQYVAEDTSSQKTFGTITFVVSPGTAPTASAETKQAVPGGTIVFTSLTGVGGLGISGGPALNPDNTCLIVPGSLGICDADGIVTVSGVGTYTLVKATGLVSFVADANAPPGAQTPLGYKIFDVTGAVATGSLTVTIPVPPVVRADTSAGQAGSTQNITVLANDAPGANTISLVPSSVVINCAATNIAGATCTSTSITVPGEGTYTVDTASGDISFNPVAGTTGVRTPITYSVSDSLGQTRSSTVTVTVLPPPAPEAVNDSGTAAFQSNVVFDTLANDSAGTVPTPGSSGYTTVGTVSKNTSSVKLCGPTESAPNCTLTTVTTSAGVYTVNTSTGVITFAPVATFYGTPVSTPVYQMCNTIDNAGDWAPQAPPVRCATATVIPTITAPPLSDAILDTSSGDYNTFQKVNVVNNDTTPTGVTWNKATLRLCGPGQSAPNCTLTTLTVAGEGTYVVNNTTGEITFTPLSKFAGRATPITYVIADSLGRTDSATFTATVRAPGAPSATSAEQVVPAGGTRSFPKLIDTTLSISSAAIIPVVAPSPVILATGQNLQSFGTFLCDPFSTPAETAPNCTKTTVVIPNQGTYTLNQSTGIVSFSANSHALPGPQQSITYMVTDITSQTATATLTPIIIPAPDLVNDNSAGIRDANQVVNVLANDNYGYQNQHTTLDVSSVYLCNPNAVPAEVAPNCATTSLVVTGVGTYTVNPADGKITFDPLYAFKGTAAPVTYVAADGFGQIDSATLTVTVSTLNPVAVDDSATTLFEVPKVFSPGANDAAGSTNALLGFTTVGTVAMDLSTVRLCGSGETAPVCTQVDLTTADGAYHVNIVSGDVTYTPNANFSGVAVPATYVIANKMTGTWSPAPPTDYTSAVIRPTVGAPAALVLNADRPTISFDNTTTINVLGNDTKDANATILATSVLLCDLYSSPVETAPNCSQTSLTIPGQGVYTVNNDGTVSFNPDALFHGAATTVTYQVSSDAGQTSAGSLSLSVSNPTAPTASAESKTLQPGDTVSFTKILGSGGLASGSGLQAGATNGPCLVDVANSTCVATLVAAHGTWSINQSTGVVSFTAALNAPIGNLASVSYRVTDVAGQTATASLTPTVFDNTTTVADHGTGQYNTPAEINVLANDTSLNSVTYDSGTLVLCGTGDTPPVCTYGSVDVYDPVTTDLQGTYSVVNGKIVFTPTSTFLGTAQPVRYAVNSSDNHLNSATVDITVAAPADPNGVDDTSAGRAGQPQTKSVLTNDLVPVVGMTFIASSLKLCNPTTTPAQVSPNCSATTLTVSGGVYTLNGVGGITFTPNSGFSGAATPVTYQVTTNTGQFASATYTPTVTAAPTVVADTSSGNWDIDQTFSVLTNDNAAAGTTLNAVPGGLCLSSVAASSCTASSLTVAGEGVYSINQGGTVTFNPDASFVGTATPVKYAAVDGLGQITLGTITVTVTAATPPTATAQTKQVIPGGSVVFTTLTGAGGLASPGGPALDPTRTCLVTPGSLTLCDSDGVVTIAGEGTYTLDATTGVVTFAALANATAGTKTSVSYKVFDITGASATAALTPSIPLPPTVTADVSAARMGAPQTINPLSNDSAGSGSISLVSSSVVFTCPVANAPSGSTCSARSVTIAGEGSYTINSSTGVITFAPLSTFSGIATPLTYSVTDSTGQTGSSTITATVLPKTAPVAVNDTGSAAFSHDVVFSTLSNDSAGTVPTTGASGYTSVGTLSKDATSVRLCGQNESVPDCTQTSVTTAEGTYTVNTTSGDITFTPAASFSGTPSSTPVYQMCNSVSQTGWAPEAPPAYCATATIIPTIAAPLTLTAPDATPSGSYNSATEVNVLATVTTDPNLTVDRSTFFLCGTGQTAPNCNATSVTVAGEGTYTLDQTTGKITFTPLSSFSGTSTPVTYVVSDSLGRTDSGTFSASVAAPTAPTASSSTVFVPEGGTRTFASITAGGSPLATGTGLQSSLTFLCDVAPSAQVSPNCNKTSVTVTGEGTYTLNQGTGVVSFTATVGATPGVQSGIRYMVTDATGQHASSTLNPTIVAKPVATNDSSAGILNANQVVTVLSNDTAGNNGAGAALTATSVKICNPATAPPQTAPNCSATTLTVNNVGVYTVNNDGTITFDPDANYVGTAPSITYQVSDSLGQVGSATLTVTVASVEPVIGNDVPTTAFETPVTFDPTTNDAAGTLPGQLGFTSIGTAALDASSVRLCGPSETAPNCTQVNLTTADGAYHVNTTSGEITFTPGNNVQGTVTAPVNYQICNVLNGSWSPTPPARCGTAVIAAVVAAPAALVPHADTPAVVYGTSTILNVLANDTKDPNVAWVPSSVKLCDTNETSPNCSLSSLTVAGEGTYTVNGNGTITFVPVAGFAGAATAVTYQASTDAGQTASGSLTAQVANPTAPVATNETKAALVGSAITFTKVVGTGGLVTGTLIKTGSSGGPCFIDVNSNCVTSLTLSDGVWSMNQTTGIASFTASAQAAMGNLTAVTYRVTDFAGQTATGTLTPTLSDTTTMIGDTAIGAYNTATTVDVLANDIATGGVTYVGSTLKLCGQNDAAPACTETTLTVRDPQTNAIQGVYSVANGSIVFTPDPSFTGTAVAATYSVEDSTGHVDSATVAVTVTAPSAPTAVNDTKIGGVNQTQTISVLTNDSVSASGMTLVSSTLVFCGPSQSAPNCSATSLAVNGGTYSLNGVGGVLFTPTNNFVGTADTVTYQISSNTGQTASATVTATVLAIPVASNDTITTTLNTPGTVNIKTNDSAATGTSLVDASFKLCATNETAPNCASTSVTIANKGTYSISGTTVTFTPTATFVGTAPAVTYVVADALGQVVSATVTGTVTAPALPTVVADTMSGPSGAPLSVNVLDNDTSTVSGVTIDPTTIVLCGSTQTAPNCDKTSVQVAGGTYSVDNTGVVTFTPDAGFTGTAPAVIYQVSTNTGQTVSGSVTATSIAPPTLTAKTSSGVYLAAQNKNLATGNTATSGTSLVSSSLKLCDPTTTPAQVAPYCDKDTLTVPGVGDYTLNGTTVTFVPLASFTGTAPALKYTQKDALNQTGMSTFTVTVDVPAASTGTADVLSGAMGAAQSVDVLANDSVGASGVVFVANSVKLCASGQQVPNCTATSVTVAGGTYAVNSLGIVTFTPAANFSGDVDAVTYQVTTNTSQIATSTVDATVIAKPVLVADSSTGAYNTAQAKNLLSNDAASAGTTLSNSSLKLCDPTTTPAQVAPNCDQTTVTVSGVGTYSLSGATVTFTPVATFTGAAPALKYTVADALGQVSESTFTATVASPAAPTGVADVLSAAMNTPSQVNVLTNDTVAAAGQVIIANSVKLCDTGEQVPNCTATSVNVTGGVYSVDSLGLVTFTPDTGYAGSIAAIDYQARTNTNQTYGSSVDAGIVAAPTLTADTSTGAYNTAQSVNVLTGDSAAVGTTLDNASLKLCDPTTTPAQVAPNCNKTSVTVPGEGTYVLSGTTVTFTPVASFTGPATPLKYTIADALGQTSMSTYTPSVTAPPAPTAVADVLSGPMGAPQSANVLTNDTVGASGVTITASTIKLCAANETAPSCTATSVAVTGGTYTVSPQGVVTFTPTSGFSGTAPSVTYVASTNTNQTLTGTVSGNVLAPPALVNDTSTGVYNTAQSKNLVTNDSATTGTTLVNSTMKLCDPTTTPAQVAPNCAATTVTISNQGTYVLSGTTVTFTPIASFVGAATSLNYSVEDALGQVATATYTPTVAAPPAPTGVADTLSGPMGAAQSANVLSNDTVGAPGVTITANTLRLCDTNETVPNCTATSVTVNGGTYTASPQGVVTFTPSNGFVGTAPSATYQATTNTNQTVSGTVEGHVIAPPALTPDASTGAYNTAQSANLLTGDSATAGTTLVSSSLKLCDPTTSTPQVAPNCSATTVTIPGEGTYSLSGTTVTFTPVASFTGAATPLNYSVADALGQVSQATYTPTVSAPPAPSISADVLAAPMGVVSTVDVLANDTVGATGVVFIANTVKLCGTSPTQSSPNCDKTSVAVTGGTYSVNSLGIVSFTPTAGYSGDVAPINYQVSTNTGQTASSSVDAAIIGAPNLVNDTSTGAYNTSQSKNLITNDTAASGATLVSSSIKLCDPNSSPAQVAPNCDKASITVPGKGTYVLSGTTVTFTPVAAFTGTAPALNYSVADAFGQTSMATYTATVTAPPAPTAVADSLTGPMSGPQSTNVLANDTVGATGVTITSSSLVLCDPSTNPVQTPPNCSATSVAVSGGTYSVDNTGVVTFTPSNGFSGTAPAVTYQATTNTNQSLSGTVTARVLAPPALVADTSTGAYNTAQTKNLITNDSASSGTTLVNSSLKLCDPTTSPAQVAPNCNKTTVTVPGEGTYVLSGTTVTFTPVVALATAATPLKYTVADALGQVSESTYTPTVSAPPAPLGVADSMSGAVGAPQSVNVLSNDTVGASGVTIIASTAKLCAANQTPPNCSATSVTVNGGVYTINNTGVVTFTPANGFSGAAPAVTYQATTNTGQVLSGSVSGRTIGAPDLRPDTATGAYNVAQTANVLANDSAAQGTSLVTSSIKLCGPTDTAPACSQTSVVVAGEGTYSLSGSSVVFTPLATFAGTASGISYSVADALSQRATGTVTFTVTPPAPPTAENLQHAVAPGQTISFDSIFDSRLPHATGTGLQTVGTGVLCLVDPSNSSSCVSNLTTAQGVWTVVNAVTGEVSFTAAGSGLSVGELSSLTYRVSDITGQHATATLTPVYPPPPLAQPDYSQGAMNATQVVSLMGNDRPSLPIANLDPASIELECPSTATCGTTRPLAAGVFATVVGGGNFTVTIPGEGVYYVLLNGAVKFVPETGVTGTGTEIGYSIADNTGQRVASTLQVRIFPSNFPTARTDTGMAAYGQNVTFRPWLNDSPGVVPAGSPEPAPQMVPASVRLCDVNETVPTCASTTVTTDDGRYVVNTTTGAVVFTPVAGFHGTATSPVTYQISNDWTGASGVAVATASLIPTIALPGAPVVAPPDLQSSPDSPVSFDPLAGGLGGGNMLASSLRLCTVDEIAPNCTATSITTEAGTFTVDLTTGQITFTPGPGFSEGAPAALTFAAADSSGNKVFASVAIAEPAVSAPIALVLGKLARTGLSGGLQPLMFGLFLLFVGAGMVYYSSQRSRARSAVRKDGDDA